MKKLFFYSILLSLLLPTLSFAYSDAPFDVTEFTILHTSDIHAHLMQFDSETGETVGGYARIKSYKDSLEKQGRNVLMLSSGDISQGTFFYRFFQGIPDIEFMNQTGYAAMTLGNHEFDNGQPALAEMIALAEFPILSANIEFKKIPQLQKRIKPYVFVNAGGSDRPVKVAIIGLIAEELKSIVQPVFVEDFDVREAEYSLKRYLPEIKKAKPDMILLLSHLGWEKEVDLFEKFPELDGVLGGHTHLAISPPVVTDGERGHRFISQPGEFGQNITRYDVSFYRNSDRKIEICAAGLVKMDSKISEDYEIAEKVKDLWEQIQVKVVLPLGTAEVFLNGERTSIRNVETNLGNLLADCLSDEFPADMALINGGGIRSSIATGTITVGDCLNVLPFDNYLVRLTISGESLRRVFSQVAMQMQGAGGFGGFLQVSKGLEVDYRPEQPLIFFNGKKLEDNKLYTVTTNDFLASGGNGLLAFTEAVDNEASGKMAADVFMKYIKAAQTVNPPLEGRIKTRISVKKVKMPKGIVKTVPAPVK